MELLGNSIEYLCYDDNNFLLDVKIIKKINDPRYVSIEYLLEKLLLIFPSFKTLWNLLKKIQFLKSKTIKVDLKDLKLFIANKN